MRGVKDFSVVILCGGKATRLGELGKTTAKSMIQIDGKPFIEHQILQLKKNKFKKIVLCLGHLGSQVVDFVMSNKKFGMDIKFSFDGLIPMGTGGAIEQAFPLLTDTFFVMYGDSYLDIDYQEVLRNFKFKLNVNKNKPWGIMVVYKNNGMYDKSNIEYNYGAIKNYDKENPTPEMEYIDYGLSILNKKAFKFQEKRYDLSLVYKKMLAKKRLVSFLATNRFYEIGSFEGIRELENKFALDKNKKI